MSEIFTNILTKIGQQKKALAEYNNGPLSITKFKIGDGNGAYYEPNENQTSLVNTKYTGMFVAGTESQIVINPAAANEVLYKCFIPADIGGFTIRELGL
ncbi:MAG: phage tail protein, partial [bacterium]